MNSLSASPRAVASRMVAAWLESGDFPDRMLDRVQTDHAMVMDLVMGVIRSWRLLDHVAGMLVPKKPRPEVEGFLLVGLYQLLLMSGMAEHAAVHETVEAAKLEVGRNTADFINAVLRRVTREREKIQAAMTTLQPAIRLSHPDDLFQRWCRTYGADRAVKLCEWNNAPPDVIVRVKSAADYLETLKEAGVTAAAHPSRPDTCIVLPRGVRVTELPGFAEGSFTVQDPSTLTAPELLDAQAGEVVLDACAAPGGKTMLIAEQMKGDGVLVAMDKYEDRLRPLRENLKRLGHAWVKVMCCDALKAEGRFDRILLDVPCSNTGVIRRRPDARWRFSSERLEESVRVQEALLDHAATLLKPHGTLVYSTCSLEPEENEMLLERWLLKHPEFSMVKQVRLFPPDSGTDGAYAASCRRH